MTAGHTTKQTLTPYRRELLERAADLRGINRFSLRAAGQHQLKEMERFGWVETRGSRCVATDAGRSMLSILIPEGEV